MNYRCVATIAVLVLTMSLAAPFAGANDEPITNPVEAKIAKGDVKVELQLVADGLGSPVWLTNSGDGSGRLFVVDQAGKVWLIKGGKLVDKPFLDVSDQLVELRKGFDERGLLGLAFHPGFADANSPGHRKFYTYQSEAVHKVDSATFTVDMSVAGQKLPFDHQAVIAEWTVSKDNPDVADKSSKRVVLRIDQPQFNHDGGCIVFDNDGMLLIGLGDGGAANDLGPGHSKGGNGQDTDNVLGTILRIDPTATSGKKKWNGAYSVPFDNPKYEAGCCLEEIVAYGMRNPWRMSMDREKGILIVGDVGQEHIEEINLVKPKEGGNFGWPLKEGPYYFHQEAPKGKNITVKPANPDALPSDLIDPVAYYDHDEGISIVGGYIYCGAALPQLKGQYVFGEWRLMDVQKLPNGKTKRVPLGGRLFVTDVYAKNPTITEIVIGADDRAMGDNLTGLGEGEDGEIYVLTNKTAGPLDNVGKVYKVVPIK